MPTDYFYPTVVIALGATIWLNAAATDGFCVSKPNSPYCDNPRTPGPEFPHGAPEMPAVPIGSFVLAPATANSTVSTINGTIYR